MFFLSQPPDFWDYKHAPPCPGLLISYESFGCSEDFNGKHVVKGD
jgi:hypothetical protein